MSDWKQHHADESEKAIEHELAENAIQEFAKNMKLDLDGLPGYGLQKVCSAVAQVARAQALGFDPDLLRLSPEEASEELLRLAQAASEAGVPTWTIEAEGNRG